MKAPRDAVYHTWRLWLPVRMTGSRKGRELVGGSGRTDVQAAGRKEEDGARRSSSLQNWWLLPPAVRWGELPPV